MIEVKLPYNYKSRPYQKEFYDQVRDYSTIKTIWKPTMIRKRGVLIHPRRHWKDKSAFNEIVIPAALQEVWLYLYIFPEYWQWRKAFWENIDNDWFKLLNHIPKSLIKSINNSEMKIELINGSIIRVVGTDKNVDTIIGSNPRWVIFSEFAIANPIVRDLIRPMLLANNWRAFFVYTPRWKNHWRVLYQTAIKFPDVYALSIKTAKETLNRDGNRIFSDEMLQQELNEWMDQNLWEQEYFCSFEANLKWAVYSAQLLDLANSDRVCALPYELGRPVYTFWDLWVSDATAIWFVQIVGKEIRIIDHYEAVGMWIRDLVDTIYNKGYIYVEHWLPHDADYRVQGEVIETKKAMFERLGLKNVRITPNIRVDDWIQATKMCFSNMRFDKEKCANWLNAIKSYVYDYNEKLKTWSKEPRHDWASHTADALRYLWVAYNSMTKPKNHQKAVTPNYRQFL